MKKNDIFRWSYKESYIKEMSRYGDLYWCKAQIAVFDGKWLHDIYWGMYHDSDSAWTEDEAMDRLELQYLGNFDELEGLRDNRWFYDEKDIVDLTHPNSYGKQVYKRKGATRSRERMIEYFLLEKKTVEQDIKSLQYKEGIINTTLKNLEDGEDLSCIYR